ncbi:MAG TPA: hypothetical protein VMR28_03065 [Candidatus Saccharimonadales bacterium]|nr:hypothetical protein [Candidatus Saccharimonadales bacterium]
MTKSDLNILIGHKQKIWEDDHKNNNAVPALAGSEISSQVTAFIDYLRDKNIQLTDKAVGIGSGKGRNVVYCHPPRKMNTLSR